MKIEEAHEHFTNGSIMRRESWEKGKSPRSFAGYIFESSVIRGVGLVIKEERHTPCDFFGKTVGWDGNYEIDHFDDGADDWILINSYGRYNPLTGELFADGGVSSMVGVIADIVLHDNDKYGGVK